MALLHPVRHEAPFHELWAALVALTTTPHQRPRLMTDPDVFDVFGEDDA